jgi:hypothetical protein
MGTWQRLEVIGDMPPEAATVDLAIEKGINEQPIAARLRLDDVELKVSDGP